MAERVAVSVGSFSRDSVHGWVAVTGARASALLEAAATGSAHVRIDGAAWDGPRGWCPPDLRVFPHLSIRENLGYSGAARLDVQRLAHALGLTDVLDRRPRSASPAQRAAAALGRAMLASSRLWLLDVPFADPAHIALVDAERRANGVVVIGRGLPAPEDTWET